MLISISPSKQPNLPFRRSNAHSMTIRADESLNPKNCCFLLDPPFKNSFIRKDNNGYTMSPKIHTGTGSSPSTKILEQLGIYSFMRLSPNPELEKILASFTLPGHFITTSKKQY